MSNSVDYESYQPKRKDYGNTPAYVAVDNFVILCILDDFENFLNSPIDL
jgi:hypothetical protein